MWWTPHCHWPKDDLVSMKPEIGSTFGWKIGGVKTIVCKSEKRVLVGNFSCSLRDVLPVFLS